jgi:hypothetical protein
MRRRAALMASAWLSAAAALLAGSAYATDFLVGTDAQLRSAITSAANGDRIIFTNSITLTGDLPAVQTNVTILGNNNTLSGNNQFRRFFVGAFSGSSQVPVTVGTHDLAIANAKAVGGNGMGRGGGGAGMGGAIFVQSGGSLTLSGTLTVNGNTVTASSGAFGGGGGSAFGSGFLLNGSGTLIFSPSTGQSQTVSQSRPQDRRLLRGV